MRSAGTASNFIGSLAPDLRRAVRAALETRFYGPLLSAAGLGSISTLEQFRDDWELFARLPVARMDSTRMSASAYQWLGTDPQPAAQLFWPIPEPSKAAVLMPGFRQTRRLRFIRAEETGRLRRFAPHALAGPVSELRRLVEPPLHIPRWTPKLSHSVQVLLVFPQAELSQETRELLWRTFEVPLFAQIVTANGHLLAWECEARSGFHIATERAILELVPSEDEPELVVTSRTDFRRPLLRVAAGWTGEITSQRCDCGWAGPRLVGVRRLSHPVKALAAAASASCAVHHSRAPDLHVQLQLAEAG